ncbi:MAG: hypothetical protein WCO11_07870 [Sphingomonadales bacterium]|jgi:hypothetical protein
MKFLAALVLAALPAAAFAQAAAPAAEAPAAAKLSLDTPIEQLLADAKGKTVLDTHIPMLSKHPMLDQFKSMSLKQLQPMSGGQLTDEMLAAVAADLGK